MIICPNCNAEIEKDVTKCPYCGYINLSGAEKKYREDLEEIKTNITEAKKEPPRAFRKGLKGSGKIILLTVGILLLLAAAVFGLLMYEMRDMPREFLTAEQEAEAAAYRVLAGEQLAEAYDNKDIELLAQIFDKAYSEDRISLWGDPHYETAYAASCYVKLQKCLPNLDKEKLKKKEAEEITYYCFYFYYRAYGEDGAGIFDDIRDNQILPMIENRLGFTVEDMENFRGKVTNSSGVVRTYVHKAAKKYYGNYH